MQVRLLGEQVITDARGTVRTRSSRTVALVGYLVVHAGTAQSRQRIAAHFWPDSTGEQALTNLRRELHHLRAALDDDPALVVSAKDLCWADTDTCWVDVRAFAGDYERAVAAAAAGDNAKVLAHASAAVETYRGDFLPGGYDDWLLDARATFEGWCVELLDLLCAARSGTADMPGAVDAARRRIRLRPLEEVGYRRLIELQGEMGDRSGAVSTYHHCASVLERELGVEPDPETRAALDRLLARVTPPAVPAPQRQPNPGRLGLAAAQLVGRGTELAVLRDVWRAAAAGRPRLALVRGDPGVGKTRLVNELAAEARRDGAVVASAQCFGISGRLALAPVADWLRTPSVQSRMSGLEPVWRAEVERLVPTPRAPTETDGGGWAMLEAWQRHRFFEGLSRALLGVGRPLLLVLDNVQWCDPETLAFVTFCLSLTDDVPIMVAGTVRSENDPDPALVDWLAGVRASGMLQEIELSALDATETALLAQAVSGRASTQAEASLLQATTGGFPLYIVEAMRGAVDADDGRAPAGDLAAVLRTRLEQVSPAARTVAGLAAAVGRTFTLDLLTEASDLDADSVVRAVDELWRRRIVREVGDGYDFSHDLLRDVAYAHISPPQRWLLHRRIAQGLELLYADSPDAVSSQLAEQYARGGRGERAVLYYRRAADVAAGRLAHGEAIRLQQKALDIICALPAGRERDHQELAVLEEMAAPLNARYGYASPKLAATLARSVTLAETLGHRESTLTGLVSLWSSQFVQGRTAAAHRTAMRALAVVDPDSELAGPAHFAFAGSLFSLGKLAEAVEHFDLAAAGHVAFALSIGTRPDVHGRAWAAHAHWLLGHEEQAAVSSADALALARTTDNPYSVAVALAYAAITKQLGQDRSALHDTVIELRELCDRYRFAYYGEWALVLEGWLRPDDAGFALARRGVANLKAAGAFVRMPYWLSLLADIAERHGRPDTARATLDAAIVAGRAREDLWWLPEVLRQRAHYDDPAGAQRRLRSASRMASEHGSTELLRRCTQDLETLGRRAPTAPLRTRAERSRDTNAGRTPPS